MPTSILYAIAYIVIGLLLIILPFFVPLDKKLKKGIWLALLGGGYLTIRGVIYLGSALTH
jgi:hypothetical protein